MIDSASTKQANKKTVMLLGLVVLLMFGFGFALVPLYDLYCKETGANGKTFQVEEVVEARTAPSRSIKVRFDTMVNSLLPWRFQSKTETIVVETGKTYEIYFEAQNLSDHAIVGQAVPSVSPWQGAPYFNKTECFCFKQQTLNAGEKREMVLRFTVDPNIPDYIGNLVLSYTFLDTHQKAETTGTVNNG